jgi:hypothetical protein
MGVIEEKGSMFDAKWNVSDGRLYWTERFKLKQTDRTSLVVLLFLSCDY